MWAERAGFELRMGLGADHERVSLDFDHLDQPSALRCSRDDKAGFFEDLTISGVEFVAMTMTLGNSRGAVGLLRSGAGLEAHLVCSQAHGASVIEPQELFFLIGHDVNNRVLGTPLDLGGSGAGQASHVAGKLDGHHLHTVAKSEIGSAGFAGELSGINESLDAAGAKPSRD